MRSLLGASIFLVWSEVAGGYFRSPQWRRRGPGADNGSRRWYNAAMPRRPTYTRGIKRGLIGNWPEGVGTPAEVADRVTYTGNPLHKTYPSPAGPPALRADKAKCDRYAPEQWPRLLDALQAAIRGGCVGDFRGSFPKRAWVWINDVLHEARLTEARQTDEGTGDYHGFPVNDSRQFPEPVDRLEAAPRVQIPVI
jgi:hypothetical protein